MIWQSATLVMSALHLASASAPASLAGGNDVDLPIIRLFLGLILCVAVAVLAALAIRRFRGGGAAPNLAGILGVKATTREVEICEVQRLTPHAEVVRLNWSGNEYLVVVSNGAISLIDKRQAPERAP